MTKAGVVIKRLALQYSGLINRRDSADALGITLRIPLFREVDQRSRKGAFGPLLRLESRRQMSVLSSEARLEKENREPYPRAQMI